MMLPIQWRESYSVGVPALGTQHRRLLEIINELAIEHILGKDQEYKPFLVSHRAQSHPPSTGIS